jgi:LuxR family transcriptional regulator, maltose regulon positive regulatory protein
MRNLLLTKLHVPKSPPKVVVRPRLSDQLSHEQAVTLVCAPAGSGKSTLLSSWVTEENKQTAWISLDEGDNQTKRFLLHFIAALQRVRSKLGDEALSLLEAASPEGETVLTLLLNELSKGKPIHIILDDYHLITAEDVHKAVAFFLEHLPAQVHVLIASRTVPPLPLAKLRAKGQLGELRADDLRFSHEEVKAFLSGAMNLSLSEEEVTLLEERTEGWIVGLQLAALSLQKETDPTAFIKAFAGDNRFVLDYLLDEVFARQAPEVQNFLLTSAVLERFCASSCNALYDTPIDTQAMLETLERANLFIIPLDNHREWYRYHHLFADLLRYRLGRDEKRVLELHRRAAGWFEDHELADEAFHHFLAAKETLKAAELVERFGTATLWEHGEIATLQTWLNQLPQDMVQNRPRLAALQAWIFHLSGNIPAIPPLLEGAEAALKNIQLEPEVLQEVLGELFTLRAYVARMHGNLDESLELHKQALEHISEEALHARGRVIGGLGEVYYLLGELAASSEAFREAVNVMKKNGDRMPASFCAWRLAEVHLLQRRLHLAFSTCQEMVSFQSSHGGLGYADVQLGRLFYEYDELGAAREHLQRGIERGKQLANPRVCLPGMVYLSQLEWAQERHEEALALLQNVDEASERHHITWTWGLPLASVYRARFELARGNVEMAARELKKITPDTSYTYEALHLVRVRLLIAQDETDKALDMLESLRVSAEAGERWARLSEMDILEALALQNKKESRAALAVLETALRRTQPGGYIRFYVDEGQAMKRLLERVYTSTSVPTYVASLLEHFGQAPQSLQTQPAQTAEVLESLNDRERVILRLLAARLSDKEIAKELSLSVNTIKWYDRNIYSKLGVGTRRQAISKARELNLL